MEGGEFLPWFVFGVLLNLFICFEVGPYYVAQTSLELAILLP
jgi:hypothetical protein